MPKTTDSLNLDLEDLLATRGFEVTAMDSAGKSLPTVNGADILEFHFHRDGKDYGTVMISIDGLKDMTVYYDDKISNSGVNEDDLDGDRGMNGTSWLSLVKQLKKFALRHQLGFKLRSTDRVRTDMKRRTHNNKLSESYDGMGFSVRSDILWPATIFESTNPVTVQKFNEWLNEYRDQIVVPKQEQECVLAMMIVGANEINVVHGPAKFMGETSTHYILDNGDGEHQYSKKNQIVFKNNDALKKCIMIMTLKFADQDLKIKTQELPVMEAFDHRKNLRNLKEGAVKELDYDIKDKALSDEEFEAKYKMTRAEARKELGLKPKKVSEGSLDNHNEKMKRTLSRSKTAVPRQPADEYERKVVKHLKTKHGEKSEGKNKKESFNLAEASDTVIIGTNNAGKEIFWVEMDHKNPARSMNGIGRPDNGTEGRSVGYVIRDDQGRWREMTSDIGRVPYEYGNQSHPEKLTADQVFMRIKERLAGGGTQIRPIAGHPSKQTKLDEGYYGNRKMSYSDDTPTVKMVIKHNRQLEETDKRFRNIEKIFLETGDGERFSVPTLKPSRARMFARHIAEGGGYKDERWSHLTEICEDIDNLGGFIRATRASDQFNESAQRMISEAADKYSELRQVSKRLQTSGGYNNYFESYEPAVKNDDDSDLLEVFKHSSVDGRIERAMPTLKKLGIRRGKLEEADQFESWADNLIDESLDLGSERQTEAIMELLADELPVGPNAEVVLGELEDVIESDELADRLRKIAEVDSNSDARPQIIAWMQEQNRDEYRDVLDKISQDDSDSEKQAEPKNNQSQSTEPVTAEPKKQEQRNAAPELPPLSEDDAMLMSFKRLLEK